MGEQHHARPAWVAFCGGDQIAKPIGRRGEAETRHFGGEAPAHTAFVAAETGDQHKRHRERPEAVARRTGARLWIFGYLPAPAVSPMTI